MIPAMLGIGFPYCSLTTFWGDPFPAGTGRRKLPNKYNDPCLRIFRQLLHEILVVFGQARPHHGISPIKKQTRNICEAGIF